MPFLGTTGGGSVKQYGGQANLGYFIKNSLRFRSSASAYLNRTFGTPTSNQKMTLSCWVKLGSMSQTAGQLTLLNGGDGTQANATNTAIQLRTDGTGLKLQILCNGGGAATVGGFRTFAPYFRDSSAWYHIVLAADTTQATAANRYRGYINGVEITSYTGTDPNQNVNITWLNTAVGHLIGRNNEGGGPVYSDTYITEMYWIDGQALTPSSFGKTDAVTGQWIPKKFAGTYGTNGFYLKFADASAATAAAIGKDSSPNGNNWTPNNISVTAGVTYDAMIDSPSLSAVASNYATLNPLTRPVGTGGAFTVGQGNLQTAMSYIGPDSTIAMSSGKWYWEVIPTGGTSGYNPRIGIVPSNHGTYTGTSVGDSSGTYGYEASSGQKGSGGTYASYGSSYTDADVIGVALDMDNGKLWFSKNGVWNASGDPAAGTNAAYTSITGEYFASVGTGGTGGGFTCHFNFGQRPFTYTPPSGFKSLNTFNLP